jgi:D-galactarolactone cycloisomerase
MRIRDLRIYTLRAPIEQPFYFSQPGEVRVRSSLIVEIVTDEGISGFGEAVCYGHQSPDITRAIVVSSLRDIVLNQDPFDVGVLFEVMYNRTKDFGMKGAVIGAISAVDIALWDVIGIAAGKPIHKLLGGAFRTEAVPYATGFYRVEGGRYPEQLVREAANYADRGFRAMKLKIGFGLEEDLRVVKAVRNTIGRDLQLMVDANHAYNVAVARRLIRELDLCDVFWLEEPISPEDIDGYAELRAMGPALLVACGENEFTRYGFWPWVSRRAVDILQPDIAAAGGFTGLRQILSLTLAAGLLLNPHVWGTAISLAASLHFLATIPQNPISRGAFEPLLEFDQSAHPFRRELIENPIDMHSGRVTIPDGPGLGIKVNRTILERYSS